MATDPRWGGGGFSLPDFNLKSLQSNYTLIAIVLGVVALVVIIFLVRRAKNKSGGSGASSLSSETGSSSGVLDSIKNAFTGSSTEDSKFEDIGKKFDLFNMSPEEEKERKHHHEKDLKEFNGMDADDKKRKRAEVLARVFEYLDEFQHAVQRALKEIKQGDTAAVHNIMDFCIHQVSEYRHELDEEREILGKIFSVIIADFLNNLEQMFTKVNLYLDHNNKAQAKNLLEAIERNIKQAIVAVGTQKTFINKSMGELKTYFKGCKEKLKDVIAEQKRILAEFSGE